MFSALLLRSLQAAEGCHWKRRRSRAHCLWPCDSESFVRGIHGGRHGSQEAVSAVILGYRMTTVQSSLDQWHHIWYRSISYIHIRHSIPEKHHSKTFVSLSGDPGPILHLLSRHEDYEVIVYWHTPPCWIQQWSLLSYTHTLTLAF